MLSIWVNGFCNGGKVGVLIQNKALISITKSMKRYITISIFFFWQTTLVSGQTIEVKAKIDSLKYLGVDAFNCNSVFWRIIANRKEAVLRLIDKISDTTITTATWKCKSTNLRVGDIAYLALREIIPVPFSDITGKQYDVIYDGCQGGVSKYIELNRLIFQKQVQLSKDILDSFKSKYKFELKS